MAKSLEDLTLFNKLEILLLIDCYTLMELIIIHITDRINRYLQLLCTVLIDFETFSHGTVGHTHLCA